MHFPAPFHSPTVKGKYLKRFHDYVGCITFDSCSAGDEKGYVKWRSQNAECHIAYRMPNFIALYELL